MTIETVTCKSCQYSRWNWRNPTTWGTQWAWTCSLAVIDEQRDYDAVTGKTKVTPPHNDLCSKQRGRWGNCGEEGRLWQPKHSKDFFVYLRRVK